MSVQPQSWREVRQQGDGPRIQGFPVLTVATGRRSLIGVRAGQDGEEGRGTCQGEVPASLAKVPVGSPLGIQSLGGRLGMREPRISAALRSAAATHAA